MIGRTNAGGGGGGISNAFATIGVTYPAGSTCTCSNGSKTLKARDTSGAAMFGVPSVGTWTVTCTNGTQTASSVVSITAAAQVKTVELSYAFYLFKAGKGVADGYTTANNYASRFNITDERILMTQEGARTALYFSPRVSRGNYKKLKIRAKVTSAWAAATTSATYYYRIGMSNYDNPIANSLTADDYTVYANCKWTVLNKEEVFECNISSIDNPQFVLIWNINCTVEVYDVWLE